MFPPVFQTATNAKITDDFREYLVAILSGAALDSSSRYDIHEMAQVAAVVLELERELKRYNVSAGEADQCQLIAKKAVEALDLDWLEASPNRVFEAIRQLKASQSQAVPPPPTTADDNADSKEVPHREAEVIRKRVGKASYLVSPDSVAINGLVVADQPLPDDGRCVLVLPTGKAAMCADSNRPRVYRSHEEAIADLGRIEDDWLAIAKERK